MYICEIQHGNSPNDDKQVTRDPSYPGHTDLLVHINVLLACFLGNVVEDFICKKKSIHKESGCHHEHEKEKNSAYFFIVSCRNDLMPQKKDRIDAADED